MHAHTSEPSKILQYVTIASALPAPPSSPPPGRPWPPLTPEAERYHQLIDELVVLSKLNRERLNGHQGRAITADAMNFGTVRCYIGRDAGSTQYILRTAKRGDLVVVTTAKQERLLRQYASSSFDVMTAAQFKNYYCRPQRYNTIFVDEPTEIFAQLDRHFLYGKLAKDPEQTFILLGQ